jgi:di/tripeptidase
VGVFSGGTSVNTIAQNASMLFEYRSNDPECLAYMEEEFNKRIAKAKEDDSCKIEVEIVGIRPCGKVEGEAAKVHEEMIRRACEVSSKYSGMDCPLSSGSTDCNIPLSLGIPAICPGLYLGGGAHTREEWLEIKSLETGLKIAAELILDYYI